VPVRGASHLWLMPCDGVISEASDRIHVPTRREKLEGADSDVARCDASQYSARQSRLAPNRLAAGHGGKRSGCWNPERRHSLADDVLAQHRPEGRTSVAAPGIRRRASPFELDIARTPAQSITSPRRMARPSPS
jgi:hypothetical protein